MQNATKRSECKAAVPLLLERARDSLGERMMVYVYVCLGGSGGGDMSLARP